MSNPNLGNKIYSGVATFGVVVSTVLAIFGTLFGIIFIVSGFKLRSKYSNRSSMTNGIVINNPNCKPHKLLQPDKEQILDNTDVVNEVFWNCTNVQVSYKINDKVLSKTMSTDDTRKLIRDDSVIVYFDPDNTENVSLEPDNRAEIGLAFIFVGISVLVLAFLRLYLSRRYKFIAALGGASTAADLIF